MHVMIFRERYRKALGTESVERGQLPHKASYQCSLPKGEPQENIEYRQSYCTDWRNTELDIVFSRK